MSRITSAYRTFVLRFWQEPQATEQAAHWRFSLEDAETKTRYGFRSMGELVNFLEKRTTEGDASSEP